MLSELFDSLEKPRNLRGDAPASRTWDRMTELPWQRNVVPRRMLATRPDTCLVLHVGARGGSEQTVRRWLNGRSCTS